MGNHESVEAEYATERLKSQERQKNKKKERDFFAEHNLDREKFKSFPGSAFLEKTFCGSIDTTDPSEYEDVNLANRLLKKADIMCVSSPSTDVQDYGDTDHTFFHDEGGDRDGRRSQGTDPDKPVHPSSALLARALVSEVTDNPKTMKPAEMAAREKKLIKAQEAASRRNTLGLDDNATPRPVGTPGAGVGPPHVFSSIAYALTGDEAAGGNVCVHPGSTSSTTKDSMMAPGPLQENRAARAGDAMNGVGDDDSMLDHLNSTNMTSNNPYAITIGLSLSRRHAGIGHPDSVTRQTAFDFNELQDRQYKYVSSTDKYGWRAGGGERGGPVQYFSNMPADDTSDHALSSLNHGNHHPVSPSPHSTFSQPVPQQQQDKIPMPDSVHIPIIHLDCQSAEQVDQVIHALASGEIFIPHMTVLPEALSVNGVSPPDLVVRFGCERNDDLPPDEWPNWCLEFMHNQLYEYFYSLGARWMKRPFSITLARKVRWKTVKHMNRYFSHAERVIDAWREKGPVTLDPQLSYIEGGATPEEVSNPHGIYLLRNGVPTNYFAPNFDPPYTTKMTRSLLLNVLGKSWDKKRREWTSEPIPRLVTPTMLLAVACGCTDPGQSGFMASEATNIATRKPSLMSGESGTTPAVAPAQHHQPQQQQHIQEDTVVTKQQQHLQRQPLQIKQQLHSPIAIPQQQQHQQQTAQMLSPSPNKATTAAVTLKHVASIDKNHILSDDYDEDEEDDIDVKIDIDFDDAVADRSSSVAGGGMFEERYLPAEPHHHHQQQHAAGEEKKTEDEQRYAAPNNKPAPPQQQPQQPVLSPTNGKNNKGRNSNGNDNSRTSSQEGANPSVSGQQQQQQQTLGEHGEDGIGSGARSEIAPSVAASGYTTSIAASGTTIMHQNLSSNRLTNKTSSGKVYSDEDWNLVPASKEAADPPGGKLASPKSPLKVSKKDKAGKNIREALEEERSRQNELLAMAHQASSKGGSPEETFNDHAVPAKKKQENQKPVSYAMEPVTPTNQKKNADLQSTPSDSGISLEYSTDGSSAFFRDDGGSVSLLGQQFADGMSVTTTGSVKQKLSREEDDGSLSIQESTSSAQSYIPTDEELFVIGWAKALDPKSGNYYYFTLDRKTIVWDSPLANHNGDADAATAST